MTDVIDVQLHSLYLDPAGESAVILLGERPNPQRVLPIIIGSAEAQSIAIGLSILAAPRPTSHDLVVQTVEAASGDIRRVDIVALHHGTFYAELEMVLIDRVLRLDVRPSDGIGVAVRAGAPIGIDRELFEQVAIDLGEPTEDQLDQQQIDRIVGDFQQFLDKAVPNDFRVEGDSSGRDEDEQSP